MEALEITLLAVIGTMLVVQGLQHARMGDIWNLLKNDRDLERTARIHEQENTELRSALRAEREHVSQLQRQVHLLMGLIPEA